MVRVQAENRIVHELARFGHQSFRENQESIINATMAGRDIVAVMPTGGGKSLCYMLPATIRDGMTVVVSPLIALMQDQALTAHRYGIKVCFCGRADSDQQLEENIRYLLDEDVKLAFISPERLSSPGMRLVLHRCKIASWVFDEAHCLVSWGHDFRPDYLRAAEYVRLRHDQVAAYTASATIPVQQEIEKILGVTDPLRIRGDVVRRNIGLVVTPRVDDGYKQTEAIIRAYGAVPGIIYRNRIADVEKTVRYLSDVGISALPYHASLKSGERTANYSQWKNGEVGVVVATIAFGMGIDKANVRYVIHGDMPRGMDDYYQQLGRAGRDGDPAISVMLWDKKDINTAMFHSWGSVDRIAAAYRVNSMVDYLTTQRCRWAALAAYYGQDYNDCGICDTCRKGCNNG